MHLWHFMEYFTHFFHQIKTLMPNNHSAPDPPTDFFGPSLPPEFQLENPELDDPEDPAQGSGSNARRVVGPQLPPSIVQEAAPIQEPNNGEQQKSNGTPAKEGTSSKGEKIIGPELPPELFGMATSSKMHFDDEIEPNLPDEPQCSMEVKQKKEIDPIMDDDEEEEEEDEEEAEEEEEGDELVGPMPPVPGKSDTQEQLEYFTRLAQLEAKKQKESKAQTREEWMTQLPEKLLKTGAFGLTAKTSFSRVNTGPSSAQSAELWTSVPNGSSIKQNSAGTSSSSSLKIKAKRPQKDEWEEERANQLNKDRDQSLLDMHQKKRKIDAPSTSLITTEKGERRPFNRDTDMEARSFGKSGGGTSTGELKEKMGELTSRFGNGTERKFL